VDLGIEGPIHSPRYCASLEGERLAHVKHFTGPNYYCDSLHDEFNWNAILCHLASVLIHDELGQPKVSDDDMI
jgi:hypothetical protein